MTWVLGAPGLWVQNGTTLPRKKKFEAGPPGKGGEVFLGESTPPTIIMDVLVKFFSLWGLGRIFDGCSGFGAPPGFCPVGLKFKPSFYFSKCFC